MNVLRFHVRTSLRAVAPNLFWSDKRFVLVGAPYFSRKSFATVEYAAVEVENVI